MDGTPEPPLHDSSLDIMLPVVDLYTLDSERTFRRSEYSTTAVTLVENGYLGNTPVSPTIAISLKTLALYKLLCQRKPSFSCEGFAKVLCDLYQKPYRRQWRVALADAFDVFLTVLQKVDELVDQALGRDLEHWHVLNACPPCMYELEGEGTLIYRVLMAIDGNESAKRVDNGFRMAGDTRMFSSSYFIPNSEVDECALSKLREQGTESDGQTLFEDEAEAEGEGEGEETKGEIPDSSNSSTLESTTVTASECVKNWKAARSDNKKRVMGMFDETGMFASGCRHGLLLWVANMVRSGEQAKYPLSIIKRALDVLGSQLLVGYDIGCAFGSTIKSTILGKKFMDSGLCTCVNAYHGYAHNFACQCANHPNNIVGMGIEDLETMEHFFSASNTTAPVIQYATKYHRRKFLDLFFKQWDKDKYTNLGVMLRNNYKQALQIIQTQSPVLQSMLIDISAEEKDLDVWQAEQQTYFATIGKEPEVDIHRVAYAEMLIELRDAEKEAASKNSAFYNAIPDNYDALKGGQTYESELSRTRKLESQRKTAREKIRRLLVEIAEMELRMGIEIRWTEDSAEYKDTRKYMHNRAFQKAVDDLQRLVVQRLFELHRLNLSGVGYRARTLLAKAMQTRSKAIQNAVNRYNTAARHLGRDPLDWSKIAKYNFVEEFNLLRYARDDIRPKKWTDGDVREAMKLHQHIKRACEELDRVNIEVRRLYTVIHDEHALFEDVIEDLRGRGELELKGAVQEKYQDRRQINHAIIRYLEDITELEGYTGSKELLGVRQGAIARSPSVRKLQDIRGEPLEKDDDATGDAEEDDDEEDAQVGYVIDFLAEVAGS
ncbi:hypothetical protein NMY22_g17977 [Coprinellus aureogranulatus]|nr:hypothetical protein NMY22_g17977 [Coprinellus aureogranulatus]